MISFRHLSACLLAVFVGCGSLSAAQEATTPKHTNRLAIEKSPYLRQHAHNPVDWYPWGDEAFAKAKKEGKPIFLSIGYSTCHWCHVMERESFEDDAVAKLINDWFVPVKVDREERPDVDRVYMTFLVATAGSGGWPMSIVVTPEGKPFFGGTYFPPEPARGLPGLKEVLTKVHDVWTNQRDKVNESADEVAKGLGELVNRKAEAAAPGGEAELIDRAVRKLATRFDKEDGGFGRAPKFPQPPTLAMLINRGANGDAEAKEMVLKTLRSIAAGGIHDHVGGGFHRYSTDGQWFLPHFEKMLYDQAQLASNNLDAARLLNATELADVARDILDYVLRDLTGEGGRFLSAEDADSAPDPSRPNEKREGAFYVWTADELAKALPGEGHAKEMAAFYFGVESGGNVKRDPNGEFAKQNVLSTSPRAIADVATKFGVTQEQAKSALDQSRTALHSARNQRPRPHRDEKTIVAWNGLMISALAKAGPQLQEPRYTKAAFDAATFIRDRLYDAPHKTLRRVWLDGPSPVEGFLDDYAFFVRGLLDLYEGTLDVQWLKLAVEIQSAQDAKFWDEKDGGYFTTPVGGDAKLLYRMKEDDEGVEPSGGGIAALNLLRMSQMLDDEAMRKRAEKTLAGFEPRLQSSADSMPAVLSAMAFASSKPQQIVIAGEPSAADTRAMLNVVLSHAGPERVILGADGGAGQAFLGEHAEFIREMKPIGGKATAYVCEDYACKQPTSDLTVLKKLLSR